MRNKFYLLSGVLFFGFISCSNFYHEHDPEFETLKNNRNSPKHVRASLSKNFLGSEVKGAVLVPPVDQQLLREEIPEIVLRDTPQVRKYLFLYTGRARKDIEQPLERRSRYLPTIEKVLNYFQLPLDLSNLAFIESKFDTTARSPQGAVGLWQFMKPTAQELGLRCNFWNDEREDVLRSSIAAAKYLLELQNKFDDWLLTLAAYNAGPGRILSAIEKAGGERDFYKIAEMDLLPQETVNHVSRFIAITMITRNPDVYDFNDLGSTWVGDMSVND